MNRNIQFNYLYRDASNYKQWGRVVFSNPKSTSLSEISARISGLFGNDNTFIAGQICVPEVFFYLDEDVTVDDHCFHEFVSVTETDMEADDENKRSIDDFIREVENHVAAGWSVFDPAESYLPISGRFSGQFP